MRTRLARPIRRIRRPGIFDSSPVPSLFIDFLAGVLDPRIVFSRTSAGTYRVLGGIATASSGVARFEADPVTGQNLGLLIEGTITNLLSRSAEVRTSPWVVSADFSAAGASVNSPDGTATGVECVANSGTSGASIYQQVSASAAAAYTWSIFLKPKGTLSDTTVTMQANNSGGSAISSVSVTFDHATQTIGSVTAGSGWTATAASISDFSNGWFRVRLTGTTPALTASINCQISDPATGDGVDGVYAWGAQLEAQAWSSSYIPTTTTALARANESATISGSAFSAFYNASFGTMVVRHAALPGGVAGRPLQIDNGTNNERFTISIGGGSAGASIVDNGSSQGSLSVAVIETIPSTHAFAYALNDFAYSVNGSAVQVDTSGTLPTVTTLGIGVTGAGGSRINGPLSFVAYYPQRLPNDMLRSMTA